MSRTYRNAYKNGNRYYGKRRGKHNPYHKNNSICKVQDLYSDEKEYGFLMTPAESVEIQLEDNELSAAQEDAGNFNQEESQLESFIPECYAEANTAAVDDSKVLEADSDYKSPEESVAPVVNDSMEDDNEGADKESAQDQSDSESTQEKEWDIDNAIDETRLIDFFKESLTPIDGNQKLHILVYFPEDDSQEEDKDIETVDDTDVYMSSEEAYISDEDEVETESDTDIAESEDDEFEESANDTDVNMSSEEIEISDEDEVEAESDTDIAESEDDEFEESANDTDVNEPSDVIDPLVMNDLEIGEDAQTGEDDEVDESKEVGAQANNDTDDTSSKSNETGSDAASNESPKSLFPRMYRVEHTVFGNIEVLIGAGCQVYYNAIDALDAIEVSDEIINNLNIDEDLPSVKIIIRDQDGNEHERVEQYWPVDLILKTALEDKNRQNTDMTAFSLKVMFPLVQEVLGIRNDYSDLETLNRSFYHKMEQYLWSTYVNLPSLVFDSKGKVGDFYWSE